LRFGAVHITSQDGKHTFRVQVFTGALKPDQLRVELYAIPVRDDQPALEVMSACQACGDSEAGLIYSAHIPATRPASDYTARVRPYHLNAAIPLEAAHILWQR
jgi:starch phosphorylase